MGGCAGSYCLTLSNASLFSLACKIYSIVCSSSFSHMSLLFIRYMNLHCASIKHILLTCVLDQRSACRDLPQFDHGVFATGQNILGVLGEDGGADLSSIMGLLKSRHAAVGDAIPQLDAAVLAAGDVAVGGGVVADATDGVCVLVQWIARHKALEGVDIIKAEGGVLRSH